MSSPVMNEQRIKELHALISLMDEPGTDNYRSIRQKITDYGKEAIPLLEDAWMHAGSHGDINRIEDLIDEIRFNDTYFSLENWAQFNNHDLIDAFFILTKIQYPDLDEEKYRQKLDRLKTDIWLEINENLTALEKVKVLNHIFYEIYKFRGQFPQNTRIGDFCLNNLLDNKKGSAIALGILYISMAHKLNIPVFGVDLQQHFVLAYMEDNQKIKAPEDYEEREVLFYIAVVNKGSAFTKTEIEHYLRQAHLQTKPSYFLPSSNLRIAERLINEMISAYRHDNHEDKAESLIKLLEALN